MFPIKMFASVVLSTRFPRLKKRTCVHATIIYFTLFIKNVGALISYNLCLPILTNP